MLYIESVDKRTFLYTEESVYETPLRLYELEERLAPYTYIYLCGPASRPL